MTVQTLSGTGTTESFTVTELLPDRTYSFLADVPVRVAFRETRGTASAVATTDLILAAGVTYRFRIRKGDGWGSTFVYCEAANGVAAYNLAISLIEGVPSGRFDKYDDRVIDAPSSDDGSPAYKKPQRLAGVGATPSATVGIFNSDRRFSILNGATAVLCTVGDAPAVVIPAYSEYEFVANRAASYTDAMLTASVVAQDGVSSFETFVVQKD